MYVNIKLPHLFIPSQPSRNQDRYPAVQLTSSPLLSATLGLLEAGDVDRHVVGRDTGGDIRTALGDATTALPAAATTIPGLGSGGEAESHDSEELHCDGVVVGSFGRLDGALVWEWEDELVEVLDFELG